MRISFPLASFASTVHCGGHESAASICIFSDEGRRDKHHQWDEASARKEQWSSGPVGAVSRGYQVGAYPAGQVDGHSGRGREAAAVSMPACRRVSATRSVLRSKYVHQYSLNKFMLLPRTRTEEKRSVQHREWTRHAFRPNVHLFRILAVLPGKRGWEAGTKPSNFKWGISHARPTSMVVLAGSSPLVGESDLHSRYHDYRTRQTLRGHNIDSELKEMSLAYYCGASSISPYPRCRSQRVTARKKHYNCTPGLVLGTLDSRRRRLLLPRYQHAVCG